MIQQKSLRERERESDFLDHPCEPSDEQIWEARRAKYFLPTPFFLFCCQVILTLRIENVNKCTIPYFPLTFPFSPCSLFFCVFCYSFGTSAGRDRSEGERPLGAKKIAILALRKLTKSICGVHECLQSKFFLCTLTSFLSLSLSLFVGRLFSLLWHFSTAESLRAH